MALTMRLTKLVLVFTAVALANSQSALAGHDEDGFAFSNRTIEGTWGFSASGTILPPAFTDPTPAVAVGIFEFDGAGLCVISDTINIGGMSSSRTSDTCEYAVNSDGSGTLQAQFPAVPGPVPLSFVLVNDANSFLLVRTDLGVASGVAERQFGRQQNEDDD